MLGSNWVGFIARGVLALNLPLFGQTDGNTVRIRLYNLSSAPREVVDSARANAARIFASAGVAIEWVAGPADSPEAHSLDMTVPIPGGNWDSRQYLVVRLVRDFPDSVMRGVLGFALPEARSGTHVTIFYDRVERLKLAAGSRGPAILGDVLAHEIGHVLLNSPDHSPAGVMKADWGFREFGLAKANRLAFTMDESARLLVGARCRYGSCAVPGGALVSLSGNRDVLARNKLR